MDCALVIFRSSISGGTATLSIRIGEWFLKNGHEVLYICQEYNDLNNVRIMNELGIKVHKWELSKIKLLFKQNYNYNNYIALTYTLDEFIFVESIMNEINIFKNILYVVSYGGLIKGVSYNNSIKYIIKKFYGNIILKLNNNKCIVYMDKEQYKADRLYYSINNKCKETIVYYLPMQLKKYNILIINTKIKLNVFNILSIARADFPFKGYLIGLIDDFSILSNKYDNITLTIISFGKNEKDIIAKINSLPYQIKSKVKYIGQTSYDDLPKYFSISHLYIGMGTTLLDAVNEGVPSIVVQPYTYENRSSGFFHMQPERLAAYEDKSVPAIKYIESVINMDKTEYSNLCRTEYESLEKNYDIEKFGKFILLNEKIVKSNNLSKIEILMHNIFKIFNTLIKINQINSK